MKKLLLSLAAFLFVSGVAFAGLQINPATGKLDKVGGGSGGAVGIGTISPGVTNFHSKYTSSYTLDDSALIFDNGTNVGIGTITTAATLEVKGASSINTNKSLEVLNSNNQTLFVLNNAGNIGIGTSGVMYNSNGQVAKWDNVLFNTSFGVLALDSTTTGNFNTAWGNSALTALTTGTKSNAVGNQALRTMTSGTNNAFGSSALQYTTGTNNAGFGHGVLFSNSTGNGCTGLGHQAGHHGCTAESIFIGHDSQFNDGSISGTGLTTESICIGYRCFVNRDNSAVIGGNVSAREINLGLNVSEPQYKITLPGFNSNTIGNQRTVASATAGKDLTILAGAPAVSGVITGMSTTPTAGGSGYVAGGSSPDEVTITTGDGTATAFIETVDGGGAVTKLYLQKPGTGYSTGTGQATSGGTGTGLTVNITGVTAAPTNLNGGDLKLSSGTSTGTGTSAVRILTATAGGSGSSDNAPSEKLTVLGSGNVGIGSTNPGAILSIPSIKATTGTRYLCIDTSGNVTSSASACSGT